MGKITGGRYIADTLKALGATHFFHVPICMPDAVKQMTEVGITPIVAHAEKAAAYMADGYARVSRRIGVCGSQAIGATNLAAGLRDAYLARIPVLAFSGGPLPEHEYKLAYQELDDTQIFASLTKYRANVNQAARIPDLLSSAMRAATSGAPMPVHLQMSGHLGNVAHRLLDRPELTDNSRFGQAPAYRPSADPTDVEAAMTTLSKSKRPVLVAGGGVFTSGAQEAVRSFARKHAIPVATALNAKGLMVEDDSLYLGVVGDYSHNSANRAVCEADLVLFVGSQTGGLTTCNWQVPPRDTQLIHIDIEPENIGRNYPSTIGLCGDASAVLGQMQSNHPSIAPNEDWLARCRELRAEWFEALRENQRSDQIPMRPERLCEEISTALPDDAIFVGDTGHAGAWTAQCIRPTHENQRFIRAHGSLGWAFPAAIGAKCAAPDRTVVGFAGDGGFLYHLSEMETAVRYGINIIMVVNNNNSLNQEQIIWEGKPEYEKNWRFSEVNYANIAEGFGCMGIRVEDPADFQEAFKTALSADSPVVIEVITDIDAMPQPAYMPKGSIGLYAIEED